jgi:hypothetical protein
MIIESYFSVDGMIGQLTGGVIDMAKTVKQGKVVDARKQALARAIVDPAFRKTFLASPEKVFGKGQMTAEDVAAIARLKKTLPALDDLVGSLAGEILCGGGGGCPGLA